MTNISLLKTAYFLTALLALEGCKKSFNPANGAASPAQVVQTGNGGLITVDHPEQFPLVAAGRIEQPDKLNVTGSVFPDISREVPVISMANGRVVDIKARLDDNVKKGQSAVQRREPGHQQCLRYVCESGGRRTARKQGLPSRTGPLPARSHLAGYVRAGRRHGKGRQGRPRGGR